jgi:hypothetical protein
MDDAEVCGETNVADIFADEDLAAVEFDFLLFLVVVDEYFGEHTGCELVGDLAFDDESSTFFFVDLHCSSEPIISDY